MFTTKKYTRPLLIKELNSTSHKHFTNFNTLVNALSPRTGANSAKVTVLANLLGGKTNMRKYFTSGNTKSIKNALVYVLKNS